MGNEYWVVFEKTNGRYSRVNYECKEKFEELSWRLREDDSIKRIVDDNGLSNAEAMFKVRSHNRKLAGVGCNCKCYR